MYIHVHVRTNRTIIAYTCTYRVPHQSSDAIKSSDHGPSVGSTNAISMPVPHKPRKTSTTLSSLYVYTYTESSICTSAIVLAIYHMNWDNACANGATLCCVYLGIKNNLVCIVCCKLLVEHSFCCYLALHKFNNNNNNNNNVIN